jgi:CRP/FNR family transcriptional regulator
MKSCTHVASDPESDRHREQTPFERGGVLFRQGEAVHGIYLIQSGLVKSEMTDSAGSNIILGFFRKGDPLGHHEFRSDDSHTHSAVAVEDSHVCVIEKGHFRSLVDSCASLSERLYRTVVTEARGYGRRLLSLVHRSVNQRVADALLGICFLYGYREDGRGVRIRIDREEMAEYAGTTKEQVSKALAEFKVRGMVSFRAKHFRHVDIAALSALAGSHPPEPGSKASDVRYSPKVDGMDSVRSPKVV